MSYYGTPAVYVILGDRPNLPFVEPASLIGFVQLQKFSGTIYIDSGIILKREVGPCYINAMMLIWPRIVFLVEKTTQSL